MVKVQDIFHVVIGAPDLDKHEEFLTDFGMDLVSESAGRRYFRGAGSYPYVHVSEEGEPGIKAVAFMVASAAELEEAAGIAGAGAVEDMDTPGGGRRVRLTMPDGFGVEVWHGVEPVDELPMPELVRLNHAREKNRPNELQRPDQTRGRSTILRLGHCVFKVTDARRTVAWFQENLGMLVTDRLTPVDNPKTELGMFLRCDRGDEMADHHTLFIIHDPEHVKLHHTSYEVQDYDAVNFGHAYMKERDWRHEWGVGRHLLGSQVFDYWRDPWGHMYERYADGDIMDSKRPPEDYPAIQENLAQWGPDVSETFFD